MLVHFPNVLQLPGPPRKVYRYTLVLFIFREYFFFFFGAKMWRKICHARKSFGTKLSRNCIFSFTRGEKLKTHHSDICTPPGSPGRIWNRINHISTVLYTGTYYIKSYFLINRGGKLLNVDSVHKTDTGIFCVEVWKKIGKKSLTFGFILVTRSI